MPKFIKCGMIQRQLTKKMFDSAPKQYSQIKAAFWVSLYNNKLRPMKWNKPTAAGTKCTCVPITNEAEQESAQLDLKTYCDQCNEKYPGSLKLKFQDSENDA